jgi:hypothetical protein
MATDRTFKLNLGQAILCRAALLRYLKQAEGLEKDAAGMRKQVLAQQVRDEREGLEQDTIDKLSKVATMAKANKAVPVDLNGTEWRAIEAGLPMLVRNARAAKGTVSSLLKLDWAEELEAMAVQVESELVPMFGEQPDLPAEAEGAEPEAD